MIHSCLKAHVYDKKIKACVYTEKIPMTRGVILGIKVKNDHRSEFSNLSNWKEEAWKNQGFNGIRTRDLCNTGAMLYQLSYEATRWERGQFIEFILPRGVKWCEVYMK